MVQIKSTMIHKLPSTKLFGIEDKIRDIHIALAKTFDFFLTIILIIFLRLFWNTYLQYFQLLYSKYTWNSPIFLSILKHIRYHRRFMAFLWFYFVRQQRSGISHIDKKC